MNNYIVRILKSFIQKISGSSALSQYSNSEGLAGDKRNYQVYGPCNEDFSPPNILAIPSNIGRDSGFLIIHAYRNNKIAPQAGPGERRLFSTNAAGDTVKAEIFLKSDETLLIQNSNGSFLMKASGEFEVNGAKITTSGNFITASGISLDEHLHSGVDAGSSNTGGPV